MHRIFTQMVCVNGKQPWFSSSQYPPTKFHIFSRGLRPGSKMCSEQMNNWQYLSIGDLEQNELFPKSKS